MSLREAIAYDADRVVCNPDEFGEASTFTPAGGEPLSCNVVWGLVEPLDYTEGFRADRRVVLISEAQLLDVFDNPLKPKRRDKLTRDPDGTPETWEVERAALDCGLWSLEVASNPTPVPRVGR